MVITFVTDFLSWTVWIWSSAFCLELLITVLFFFKFVSFSHSFIFLLNLISQMAPTIFCLLPRLTHSFDNFFVFFPDSLIPSTIFLLSFQTRSFSYFYFSDQFILYFFSNSFSLPVFDSLFIYFLLVFILISLLFNSVFSLFHSFFFSIPMFEMQRR